MKSKILLVVGLILLLTGCSETGSQPDNRGVKLPWAFLFYDDADFYNAYDPWNDFISRMYSTENLHVLVLRDRGEYDGGIYCIHPDQSYEKVEHVPWINMGDPATLGNFINFAKASYPAERYIISFYDHGGGFNGACIDDSHNDRLSMAEIKNGLAMAGGVDMVLWSAPCLMGAIESMYELREQTRVYIGSESVSGYCYWKYAMSDIREALDSDPGINTLEFGASIISVIEDNLWRVENEYYGQSRFITMSAVRTDKIAELVILFDEITRYYEDHYQKYRNFMDGHYSIIETYGANNDFNMDMFSLAGHLINYESDPAILSRLTWLQNIIEEAVVAETHGYMYPDTHGIAIHHPDKETFEFHDEWNGWYQKVEFAAATRWDEILIKYLNIKVPGSADQNRLIEWMRKTGNGNFPKVLPEPKK